MTTEKEKRAKEKARMFGEHYGKVVDITITITPQAFKFAELINVLPTRTATKEISAEACTQEIEADEQRIENNHLILLT